MSLRLRVLDALGGSHNRAVTVRDDHFAYRFVCHSAKERRRAERMLEKERGTIAWLSRELRPDDVFFDVGANIGVYTIFAARRLGPKGAVISFEPHVPNAASLIENVHLNRHQCTVRLVTSALTNSEHYDAFNYRSVQASSSSSQFGSASCDGVAFDPGFVEVEHGCTLDSLCGRSLLPRPMLIKIDVDGLECEILEGMCDILASPHRPRSLQVEVGPRTKARIVSLLSEAGYRLSETHWTQAGEAHIAQGNDPEAHAHCGIFEPQQSVPASAT